MVEETLPMDAECERYVLHAALEGGESTETLLHRLTADLFVLNAHRLILGSARALYEESGSVDRVLLARRLMDRGELGAVGGVSYLVDLAEGLPRLIDAEGYLRVLEEKRRLRHILWLTDRIRLRAMQGVEKAEVLIAELQRGVDEAPAPMAGSLKPIREVLGGAGGIEGLFAAEAEGVRITFPPLARIVPCFRAGNVITLGGGTGGGKSSLARQLVLETASQGNAVAVFSLEMSSAEVVRAMVCSMAGVSGRAVQLGRANEGDRRALATSLADLEDSGIYLSDNASLTLDAIRTEVKQLQKRVNVALVVLDYLQLIPGGTKGQTRTEAVDALSRGIKRMAMALRLPVLSLAQWSNKGSEAAADGQEPGLHHLRESGAIAQDSDVVLFIVAKKMEAGNETNPVRRFKLAVKKHRGGPVGAVDVLFDSRVTKFLEQQA